MRHSKPCSQHSHTLRIRVAGDYAEIITRLRPAHKWLGVQPLGPNLRNARCGSAPDSPAAGVRYSVGRWMGPPARSCFGARTSLGGIFTGPMDEFAHRLKGLASEHFHWPVCELTVHSPCLGAPRPLLNMEFAVPSSLFRSSHVTSVLAHRAARWLHVAISPRLAMTSFRFAHSSPPSGWMGDFHLQVTSRLAFAYRLTAPFRTLRAKAGALQKRARGGAASSMEF